jgi:hypothetical protein
MSDHKATAPRDYRTITISALRLALSRQGRGELGRAYGAFSIRLAETVFLPHQGEASSRLVATRTRAGSPLSGIVRPPSQPSRLELENSAGQLRCDRCQDVLIPGD